MRTQLKLLTLAIACALLYDGCKSPEPEIKTTISVELVDGKTNLPVPNIKFIIEAEIGNSLLSPNFQTIDTVTTNLEGKFNIILSSKKNGNPRSFAVNVDVTKTNWRSKYYNLQCTSSIDLCTSIYPGETKTISFSAY